MLTCIAKTMILAISKSKPDDNYIKVSISEKLSKYNENKELDALIESNYKEGIKFFLLDLSKLTYINSIGINTITSCIKKASSLNTKVILFGLEHHIEDAIKISCIHHVAPVVKTEEEALQYMSSH
ncbi:MAG: STAS domain-containing protein [Nitrospinae bacterium]|nr:STAS domain-containing protein [Nitrospinota bacterium]